MLGATRFSLPLMLLTSGMPRAGLEEPMRSRGDKPKRTVRDKGVD